METMPIDKFRLRFPDELESDFQEDYYRKTLSPLRLGIILGAFLYAIFGILDAYITPAVAHQTWFVRYLIVLPACAAVLLFSWSPHFKNYMQSALFFLVFVAGSGIIAMMVIVRSPTNYFHFAGLLLVIMYSYTFSKLRFLYTCLASWAIVGMYEIAALSIIHTPLSVFLNDNFFYAAANLIGMFSSYHRELYMRRDFFQNRVIQDQESQKNSAEKETLHEVAEKAILSFRESEEKFLALADTAAVAIFIHQGENFIYANRMAEIIGGYTVDEYLTMDYLRLVHPEYLDLIKELTDERLAGGSVPSQYEFKLARKDGQERWVLMTAGLMEYEGRPAIISTLIDITSRKQAEQERERFYQQLQKVARSLRESEAKFRSLAETAPAAIFIHQGGRFLYANAACLSMIGYTRDELLTRDFWDVTHPDDRETVRQRGRARVSGEPTPDRYELRIVTKNGDVRWLDMTATVIEYEGRMAALGNAFDITDRKNAEEERERLNRQLQQALQSFKESEAKFRALAETTTAAIFIHQGGKILYANPAGESIAGYTNEEFLSMDFWTIVHPAFQGLVLERARARLRGDSTPPEYEFKILTKTGEERWVLMTAGVIEYEGKPAVIGTLFDITDRKEVEEDRVRLYEQRIAEEKRHVMEKEKILMDLHDGIGGITSNISILAELALKTPDVVSIKRTLATISQLSQEGIWEVRSFMHSLDTKELSWRTLAVELRSQGTNMVEPHNIKFTAETSVEDIQDKPGSLLWVNLFKIYKEALTNIIKHSKAVSVAVVLNVGRDGIFLSIQDDGVGWKEKPGHGRGLANMEKRAQELGGKVTLSTGNGTRVTLKIPIPLKYPVSGMEL